MDSDVPSEALSDEIKLILEKFPFLTYGTLNDTAYLGVVQNCDSQLISLYDLNAIPTPQLREVFLKFSLDWWWGSNRQVPINVFLKERFRPFRPFLKHFSRKDFIVVSGPTVSLQETIARRVRKRQITLVRRF